MKMKALGVARTLVVVAAVFTVMATPSLCATGRDGLEVRDISEMTEDELSKMEERLSAEVSESDKALDALRADTNALREEQEEIDRESEALGEERRLEAQRKADRDAELDKAKADVQKKQASIAHMSVRVTELKEEIFTLEGKLAQLSREKNETEKRYNDPSLADVLNSRAARWGSVPRSVYNKTMTDIVPALSGASRFASRYRRKVSETSRALELLASLLVYGFLCTSVYVTCSVYSRVRGQLTVDRILFLGDAFCAAFWTVILVCYLFLFDDPLHVIQARSARLFTAFQLSALAAYLAYVLLRVLVLASSMTLHALGETLAVIVVGQHYYVRVWQPAMLDAPVRGAVFYYVCYGAVFAAFAAGRAAVFTAPKGARGARLRGLLERLRAARGGRELGDGEEARISGGAAHDGCRVAVGEPFGHAEVGPRLC